jgi:plastocyanin
MSLIISMLKTVTFVAVVIGAIPLLSASETPVVAKNHVVEIIQFKFTPDQINVKVGDTVTWINRDFVAHTAQSIDNSFNTGSLALNESYTLVVNDIGDYAYFCEYHPSMQAAMLVE